MSYHMEVSMTTDDDLNIFVDSSPGTTFTHITLKTNCSESRTKGSLLLSLEQLRTLHRLLETVIDHKLEECGDD